MKITEIETIALVDPGKASETLVRVHTDEGITGIGQAESPSRVIEAIIKCDEGLEQLLLGEDPVQVESGFGRRCMPAPGCSAGGV